jgi:hypothetical protein
MYVDHAPLATMRASDSLFAGPRPDQFAEGLLRVYARDTRWAGAVDSVVRVRLIP